MPSSPAPLPVSLTERPFSRRDALRAGVDDNRLRRRDLAAPFTGVREARRPEADVAGLADACRAALTVLPPGSAFSHATALRLHGVDVPWRLDRDDRVHVQLPPDAGRVRRRGIAVHHPAQAVPAVTVTGLPVVAPERAWRDCATLVGHDDLVVLGDALLRRRSPVTTLEALRAAALAVPPGARGRRRLLEAFPDVRAGTDSSMETRTRLVLVHGGLPCPDVNGLVRDGAGDVVAMPDLLYRAERIAIEYDGDIHRTERRLWRRDVERRELLQDLGWLVIVVTADIVLHHPHALVQRVGRALATRAAR